MPHLRALSPARRGLILAGTALLILTIALRALEAASAAGVALALLGLLIGLFGVVGARLVAIYRAAAILMLNTVVVFVTLEATASVINLLREGHAETPVFRSSDRRARLPYYRDQAWGAPYWDEFMAQRKAYYPYLIWRAEPSSGEMINVTAPDRTRVTPGADCQEGAYRVFMFGGSALWGTGAPDWGTIPAYVQAGLAARHEGSVCVINYGETAYVATQSLIALMLQLQRGNIPDVVIFYDGINDVMAAYETGQPGLHLDFETVAARYDRTPPLIAWAAGWNSTELIAELVSDEPDQAIEDYALGADAGSLPESVAQTALNTYRIVRALGNAYGFETYVFWQPVIALGDKPFTADERAMRAEVEAYFPGATALFEAAYAQIERAAQDDPRLIALTGVFDDQTVSIYIDFMHVTPEGNRLVAQAMLDALNGGRETP
jgi:lysophospholipase L1-like esterase